MRKCSLIIIALIFLQVNFGFAQVDKKANAILAGVSVKYKSYKSITVDFAYTLENPAAKPQNPKTPYYFIQIFVIIIKFKWQI